MHEVGHTLGLTHNFRASTVYTRGAARRPRVHQRSNGLSGSVMEYNAVNIALKGETPGRVPHVDARPVRLLGDRVRVPRARAASRKRPSSRASPPLAASRSSRSWPTTTLYYSGLDPRANTFDLGTDPLVYAERQLQARPRAVAAHRDAAAEARRELRAAAPQLHARPVRGAAERACRRPSTSAA